MLSQEHNERQHVGSLFQNGGQHKNSVSIGVAADQQEDNLPHERDGGETKVKLGMIDGRGAFRPMKSNRK